MTIYRKSQVCNIQTLWLTSISYVTIELTHSSREAPYGAPQFEHHFPKSTIWRSLLWEPFVQLLWILYGVKQRKYMHNILVKIVQLFMIIISIIIVIKSILHGEKTSTFDILYWFYNYLYIIILILFELYLVINIIIIIKLILYSYLWWINSYFNCSKKCIFSGLT